jgi:beta-N-acetylhexosaminidase
VREVGQRFVVGFDGLSPSSEIRMLIRELAVGTVRLQASNIEAPEQVAELVRELQDLARRSGHDAPLLIAIDQEGGTGTPLREPWTPWPPARAFGRLDSEDLVRRAGAAVGAELAACGIHATFAPVADVETHRRNPTLGDRALGDNPDRVGRIAAALVRGIQSARVAACVKHFPGQGEAEVDPAQALPIVGEGRGRLEDVELRPFRAAVAADVALVMTSHALYPELDERRPATLSPPLVTGLLRQGLGFAGVIVSDDLDKKALAEQGEIGTRAVLAAQAGADMLRVGGDVAGAIEAVEGLIRATEGGEFRFTERDDVRRRLKRLKERVLLPYAEPDARRARDAAGRPEHRALAAEIADRSGLAA